MSVSISIRNVPDEVRDVLASRADQAGKSLQEYMLGEVTALAERPDPLGWLERVRADAADMPHLTSEQIVSALHEERRH